MRTQNYLLFVFFHKIIRPIIFCTTENYNIIDSVRFIDSSNKLFSSEDIHLNSGLNVVIGGKSTGKSLFLHFIAKTLITNNDTLKNKGLDTKYLVNKDKKEIPYEEVHKIDFEVKWANGKKYLLSDRKKYIDASGNTQDITQETKIEFIPQQWLSDIVEKEPEEFEKLIEKSLAEKEGFDEIKKKHNNKIKELNASIDESVIKLFQQRNKLQELREELSEMGSKNDFEDNVKGIKNQILELEKKSDFTEEDKQKMSEIEEQKSEIQEKITQYDKEINILLQYKNEVEKEWDRFQESTTNLYKRLTIENTLQETNLLSEFDMLFKQKDYFDEIVQKLNNKNQDLENLKEKQKNNLKVKADEMEELGKRVSKYDLIKDLNEKKISSQSKITKIEEQLKIIEITEGDFQINNSKILATYNNLHKEYLSYAEQVSSNFKIIGDSEEKEIELELEITFNTDKFYQDFIKCFHKERQKNYPIIRNDSFFDSDNDNSYHYSYDEEKHLEYIKDIFRKLSEASDNDYIYVNSKNLKDSIEFLLKDYFKYNFKLKYENDWISNMSQGKKGIVLLKLYLSIDKANYPIIIDQPEDNLDNRTIYQTLTDFIKKRKIYRQIIMVTHNANLVVATDAEQVIVANQEGQNNNENRKFQFEYVTGALEHTKQKDSNINGILYQQGIKEHVCEILEGGKEAFKKRDEKYGFTSNNK